MSEKRANVVAYVEPKIKEQAEAILEQLGLSASDAINVFYRQIIFHRGLPFAVALPAALPTLDTMCCEEFDAMCAEGAW